MLKRLGIITSLVSQIAISVIAGLLLGGWIDEKIGLQMVFQIIFTFLGFIAGMYRLVSFLKKDNDTSPK